jgi:hypothetical protein
MYKHPVLALICLLLLTACAGSVESRRDYAAELIKKEGYHARTFQTRAFPIYAAIPNGYTQPHNTITIVIEGDGYAFTGPSTVSMDPTPKNPVGLKLALSHQKANAIYLARPCQYVRTSKCGSAYWTTRRFAPEILQSYDEILDDIKTRYGLPSTRFTLVGFSGGGYIAFNLAATRSDIKDVTTYAGLLSPEDWTAYHKVTDLEIKTPAPQLFKQSANTPFLHICSHQDSVIPCDLTYDVLKAYDLTGNHVYYAIDDLKHGEIWQATIKK